MTNHVHLLVTPPHRWRLPSSCNLLDGTLCDTSMTVIRAVCGAHIALRQTRPEPRIRGAAAHAQGLRERALFARFLSAGGRCRLCGWNRRDVTALRLRLPDRRCGGHRRSRRRRRPARATSTGASGYRRRCWDSGWTSAIGDAENEEVFCGLGSQNCRGTAGGRYPGDFEGLAEFRLPAHAPPKRSICGVALIGGMNCPVSKAW